MTYQQYISSYRWSIIRLQRLEIDGRRCVRCGHDGTHYRLEIHHKTYERLFNEDMDDLETLCVPCHDIETNRMRAERYSKRKHEPLTTQKREHGNFESKTYRNITNVNAQRPNCRPDKPLFQGYKGHKFKKEKD